MTLYCPIHPDYLLPCSYCARVHAWIRAQPRYISQYEAKAKGGRAAQAVLRLRFPMTPSHLVSFADSTWSGSAEAGYEMSIEGGIARLYRRRGVRGGRGTWLLSFKGHTVNLGQSASFDTAEVKLASLILSLRR